MNKMHLAIIFAVILGVGLFLFFKPKIGLSEISLPSVGDVIGSSKGVVKNFMPKSEHNFTTVQTDYWANYTPPKEQTFRTFYDCHGVKNQTTEYRYVKNGTIVCEWESPVNGTCNVGYDKLLIITHCNIGSGYVCSRKNITFTDACTLCTIEGQTSGYYQGRCI